MDNQQGGQTTLRSQLPALERSVRSLSRAEIIEIAEAVTRNTQEGDHLWPPDERFWFDGTAEAHVSRDEGRVLRELWTRMNAGLVYAVTGRDVDVSIDRPGLPARLARVGASPRSRIEGTAATVLERELGGQVWLGAVGIWNALCGVLLADRLAPALREDLAISWRQVRPSNAQRANL